MKNIYYQLKAKLSVISKKKSRNISYQLTPSRPSFIKCSSARILNTSKEKAPISMLSCCVLLICYMYTIRKVLDVSVNLLYFRCKKHVFKTQFIVTYFSSQRVIAITEKYTLSSELVFFYFTVTSDQFLIWRQSVCHVSIVIIVLIIHYYNYNNNNNNNNNNNYYYYYYCYYYNYYFKPNFQVL